MQYVLKSLFSDTNGQNQNLRNFLERKYIGKAILTYKGREALTLALKILDLPKESCVAINGFTCFAVYKAVEKAGLIPICLDLEKNNPDLNFTPSVLEKTLTENKNIKVIIVQNTFGYPCDIDKIKQICREKNLLLIEDLAHCAGTKYPNGKEAGTIGDFITLSFSQDKIIDSVSGGALVIRNKKYGHKLLPKFKRIKRGQRLKDYLYPFHTLKIRLSYDIFWGKVYHFILKKLNLLSKPMQENLYAFYPLPDWYCNLALSEFKKLNQQLNHRRKIAAIYAKKLNKQVLNSKIIENIPASANVRFPIFVKNRGNLIKFLKQQRIFVSDIWYDSVAPECPNAILVSKTILNLPTHLNVSEKDALQIAERINTWLKLP